MGGRIDEFIASGLEAKVRFCERDSLFCFLVGRPVDEDAMSVSLSMLRQSSSSRPRAGFVRAALEVDFGLQFSVAQRGGLV